MPTLSESPGFPLDTAEDARAVPNPAAEGSLQHAPLADQWPRVWRLVWRLAPNSVRTALDALHADTDGGAISFDWAPPGLSSLKVRFLPGKQGYSRSHRGGGAWDITVQLEEALGI